MRGLIRLWSGSTLNSLSNLPSETDPVSLRVESSKLSRHAYNKPCVAVVESFGFVFPLYLLFWALARGEEALNERVRGLAIDDAFGYQTVCVCVCVCACVC